MNGYRSTAPIFGKRLVIYSALGFVSSLAEHISYAIRHELPVKCCHIVLND